MAKEQDKDTKIEKGGFGSVFDDMKPGDRIEVEVVEERLNEDGTKTIVLQPIPEAKIKRGETS